MSLTAWARLVGTSAIYEPSVIGARKCTEYFRSCGVTEVKKDTLRDKCHGWEYWIKDSLS
jgi:hypothetical protein